MLEAGIDHPAHHQNGDSRHCQRNHVFEDAQVHGPVRSPACQIHHQVHGGDHGSRRHRNGQTHKIAALAFLPGAAAMQLNRARRNAAHSRYRMPIPQPTSGGDSWNRTALATSSAGAMPKETISAKESNSRPNGPSCPRMRAIRPSNKSNKHAAKIKKWHSDNRKKQPQRRCPPG